MFKQVKNKLKQFIKSRSNITASNNLNIIMKTLATITIVMSIPTMVFSLYGMNFQHIPLGNYKYGFGIVTLATLLLTVLVARLFAKKDMF